MKRRWAPLDALKSVTTQFIFIYLPLFKKNDKKKKDKKKRQKKKQTNTQKNKNKNKNKQTPKQNKTILGDFPKITISNL